MIETTVDGRYQILTRVAAGGMGEVFRAHDPVLNREVALKMLHATLAGDQDFIDRFRREARAAAMLSHPNIVAVHDWGKAGDTYFMVMEFIRGPNLRTLLTQTGPLQPAQAAEVVSQVLSALGHAHERGIVHRDVKPENVLITSKGVAKVADFGLARALAESRVTHAPGTVTGTVQYLAPEQIQGETADPRTDLYATGVVLYELLVGKVPFTGETSVAIAYKHLRDPIPPPSAANPMVPPSLDEVVRAATEKDREKRLGSAEEMRRRLGAASAELPPATPLAELAESVPKVDEVPPDRAPTVTIPRTLPVAARRRRALGRAARILAILAVIAAAGWGVWTYVVPHRTDVPRFRAMTVARAQAAAEEAGVELVVAREAFSSDVDAGLIVSQRPPPGAVIERGSEVRVVLSKGPEFVVVPDVTGIRLRAARNRIADARLEIEVERAFDREVPEGRVIDQNPLATTEIEVGKTVVVRVSKGPEPVDVPSVVGSDADDAQALLEAAGFRVSRSQDFSGSVPRGDVIAQSPKAGTRLPVGNTVEIVVSRGPREFPMPRVVGMTEARAREELTGLGLRVKTVSIPTGEEDEVVGQRPRPGTTVESGEQVTIYVGSG